MGEALKRTERNAALRAPSRFVGNAVNKMDAKGRVSVPADLRRQIDPDSDAPAPVLYCCPSFMDAELFCGGPELVETVLELVKSQDLFENHRLKLEKAATGLTERLSFDENGRVVVPKKFRDHAKLEGVVAFGGRGSYFTMARGEVVDDLWSILDELGEDEREVMRVRGLPSVLSKGGQE